MRVRRSLTAIDAIMTKATRREKRAMMIFILLILKERVESIDDKEMALIKYDEKSNYREYSELEKSGLITQ